MSEPIRVVVVGAGVSGLTTALLLTRAKDRRYEIVVRAEHMPGDYSIHYASPWAGANYLPTSRTGTAAAEHDKNTWPELEKLAKDHPEAGIHFQETKIFNRNKDAEGVTGQWMYELIRPEGPWFQKTMPNFKKLTKADVPQGQGFDSGISFTSVCINTAIYLPWLVSQLLAKGVVFKRAIFAHIDEAFAAHVDGQKADIVVNCTGLASGKLGGVEDAKMVPVRAQVVLVRNEAEGVMTSTSGTDDGDAELLYIMERAAGGGTIIGGCYQKGNWDAEVDLELANRIMKRAVQVQPGIVDKGQGIEGLSVVRHSVGLRPVREGGVRLERDKAGDGKGWVVHNYGHGGFGYQSSYGCALEAVKLVEECSGQKVNGV